MIWDEAQKLEKDWWGACRNTFGEEAKQFVYAQKMKLRIYDDGNSPFNIDCHGYKVLDIGCGPTSMLLKCTNLGLGVAIDPCDYPMWVADRYAASGIEYNKSKGEDIPEDFTKKFDEVWIYNVLQHTDDPEKVVKNAKRVGKVIRIFEWIDHPTNAMHPHLLTEAKLNEWLDGKGEVGELAEKTVGLYGRYYAAVVIVKDIV